MLNGNRLSGTLVLLALIVVVPCDNGVLQNSIVVLEMDKVCLPCYTTRNERVEWSVNTVVHSEEYETIYSIDGLVDSYEKTGRYSVSEGAGFYNLTIVNVTIREAGKYRCSERAGLGPHSSLNLNVNVSASESLYDSIHSVKARVGENVTFDCHISLVVVSWLYVEFETASQHKIDGKNNDRSKIVVSGANRNYSMSVLDLQVNDSGWYICADEEETRDGHLTTAIKHLFTLMVSADDNQSDMNSLSTLTSPGTTVSVNQLSGCSCTIPVIVAISLTVVVMAAATAIFHCKLWRRWTAVKESVSVSAPSSTAGANRHKTDDDSRKPHNERNLLSQKCKRQNKSRQARSANH